MTTLTEAYREYLERMIDESLDLVDVDQFTVPSTIDLNSAPIYEWANFN